MLLRKGDVKWTHKSEYNSLEKLQCCRPVQIPSKICQAAWDVERGTCCLILPKCV
jgi:hypothetical protein